MKNVEFINSLILDKVKNVDNLILYGQNINAGSCLGGLSRGLIVKKSSKIINTTNSEYTLVGMGFGLMLNGISSIFFMKQQDFLMLGIDHLVNTYNIIRVHKPKASFTIMPIVVDSGYEGPQSALNNFSDFCSIANIDGYSFTNKLDASKIINDHLIAPGFRIIGVSQRLMKMEVIDLKVIESDNHGKFFKYFDGKDLTIVCFNYSLPYGLEVHKYFSEKDKSVSLYSVNTYTEFDFKKIISDVNKTNNLLVLDDSKSGNQLCEKFVAKVYEQGTPNKHIVYRRKIEDGWFYPNSDELKINYEELANSFPKL